MAKSAAKRFTDEGPVMKKVELVPDGELASAWNMI